MYLCCTVSIKINREEEKACYLILYRYYPCKILTKISARISVSFWPARSPRSRRDLKISVAKNSWRFLPRSQNLAEISKLKSRRPKTC